MYLPTYLPTYVPTYPRKQTVSNVSVDLIYFPTVKKVRYSEAVPTTFANWTSQTLRALGTNAYITAVKFPETILIWKYAEEFYTQ